MTGAQFSFLAAGRAVLDVLIPSTNAGDIGGRRGITTTDAKLWDAVRRGDTDQIKFLLDVEGENLAPQVRTAAEAALKIGERSAAKVGAKSAEEMAKHLSKLSDARDKLFRLERQLEKLKGPKAQKPVREQIDDLLDQIGGHEKEIRQKWPELGDDF